MKADWIALHLLGAWSAELSLGTVILRLLLSLVLSAVIGCERSSKRHSAGLRTFILVSLAGTGTMLLDIYLMQQGMALPVLSAAASCTDIPISGLDEPDSSSLQELKMPAANTTKHKALICKYFFIDKVLSLVLFIVSISKHDQI